LLAQQSAVGDGEYPILTAIWAFVQENWDEILGILLKLAPLVLMDGEDE
jgi:hypothetical protein